MAERTGPLVKHNGVITLAAHASGGFDLTDGTTTAGANTYTVAREPGDFTVVLPIESASVRYDRGKATGWTRGDQAVGTITFSADLTDLTDAAVETLVSILEWAGVAPSDTATHPLATADTSDYVFANWTSDDSTAQACQAQNGVAIRYVNTCGGVSETFAANGCRLSSALTFAFDEGRVTATFEFLPDKWVVI